MGALRIMNHNGDDVLLWDKTDEMSIEQVREVFNRLMTTEKMLAYTIPARGEAEVIREFDPQADEIRMHKQHVGG
jgi:hypothetical protein